MLICALVRTHGRARLAISAEMIPDEPDTDNAVVGRQTRIFERYRQNVYGIFRISESRLDALFFSFLNIRAKGPAEFHFSKHLTIYNSHARTCGAWNIAVMQQTDLKQLSTNSSTAEMKYIKALTIAGSDSGGGAGIQADIKTMSALGVYASTAITSITVQNTQGVTAVFPLEKEAVRGQIEAVMEDIRPDAVKIGMVNDLHAVEGIIEELSKWDAGTVVLDPVMSSSSGHKLISDEALQLMMDELIPMCTLVTPNIPEAEMLSGMQIGDNDARRAAAGKILELGCKAVLIKGGHTEGRVKSDLLVCADGTEKWFSMLSVDTPNTHGTGCTLSSAITAYLARGERLDEAVLKGKRYVSEALKAGKDVKTGNGTGPLNHFFDPEKLIIAE